ncbi:MAG: ATP-binding protein [Gammaproteobacteria bacterium]
MLSLTARLVFAASVVLIAFLGLTGAALDRAYRQSAEEMIRERLMAQIYALLAAAEPDTDGTLRLPADLPDQRFSVPASGLYAAVFGHEQEVVWRSRSMLGVKLRFPLADAAHSETFDTVRTASDRELFAMSFPVSWELTDGKAISCTFAVAEERARFDAALGRFRRNLWGWFAAAAVGLLAAQGLILSWSLAPLRRVAREVAEIESGTRGRLDARQPKELRPLTAALNTLIASGRRQVERSRNALADLAHSLKTPLAVLRNASEDGNTDTDLRQTLRDQVTRMDRTVNYQLQRAAAVGRAALSPPVAVAPVANRLRESLLKVYAGRPLEIKMNSDPDAVFAGDEGDLTEVLGNLMDNACKWSRSTVNVYIGVERGQGTGAGTAPAACLRLRVEDDGPGIAPDQAERLLERGARADAATPGHGIGLAVVREIVCELYSGDLRIERSPLGGACIDVSLSIDPARASG